MKHIPRLIIYYFFGLHFACQFTPTNNAQGLEQKNVDDIITNHTIVDSIPKNRIMIEDPPPNIGNWIYVFYDKDGKVTKRVERFDLPANSKFKNLSFPRKNVQERPNGLVEYDLVNQSFARRKKILQEAGVTGVPDSVVQEATVVSYCGNNQKLSESGKFLIIKSSTHFLGPGQKDNNYIELSFIQTHISIIDHNGNAIHELDFNHYVSDAVMSDDGHYLLTIFERPFFEDVTYDIPMQVLNFDTGNIDSIDQNRLYNCASVMKAKFEDSFFQILFESGAQNIHLLVNPYERKIYSMSYPGSMFNLLGNAYQFKSMHLPNGQKINLADYLMKEY